jgi:hypothetical protein
VLDVDMQYCSMATPMDSDIDLIEAVASNHSMTDIFKANAKKMKARETPLKPPTSSGIGAAKNKVKRNLYTDFLNKELRSINKPKVDILDMKAKRLRAKCNYRKTKQRVMELHERLKKYSDEIEQWDQKIEEAMISNGASDSE